VDDDGGEQPAIRVRELRTTFRVAEREAGLRASVRSPVRRTHRDVHAVAGVSFDVAPGEVVGFLVPLAFAVTVPAEALTAGPRAGCCCAAPRCAPRCCSR
jgi:ABC-2 type transport system ATP-binding protein